ncbi:MAG: PEP-CTERM-box response regulator transcription factor [Alphaproteobacteria bacterium]|nr:PEP-CTERM-box response regulator transcription factor [Alphaproteobacteria bacterium]
MSKKQLESTQPLLLVEDDPGLRSQLRWALDAFDVHLAEDRESAIKLLQEVQPPVVVLDLGLPPDPNGASEGLAALEDILSLRPNTKVIVSSGNEERGNAVEAIRLGAYDFYPKPVDVEVLRLIIDRATQLHLLEEDNQRLSQPPEDAPLNGVIAASPQMLKVCDAIRRIATSDVSVLLTGESGTGKEVLARALHDSSMRATAPFIAINCAAIPENLLESELFGHEKGAFTGAVRKTTGKIEQAQGGTLLLDEIGDMPLPLQAKLLRFLQERLIERVGGREQIELDVRVISATNQDLKTLIEVGGFREDLFYRLEEVGVHIPSLREREGDAVLLAKFFLQRFTASLKKPFRGITKDGLAAISAYEWPGNVRELENRMKRAIVLAEGKFIGADDLDIDLGGKVAQIPTLRQAREAAEHDAIVRALKISQKNLTAAAKVLGVSRPTLYGLMKTHNLTATG